MTRFTLCLRAGFAAVAVLILASCGGGSDAAKRVRSEDPHEYLQWYLFGDPSNPEIVHINLPRGERYTGRGVLVSIVDNGVDIDHADLSSNIAYGNFSYLPQEYGFSNADHGTAVAGLIAAQWGNNLGGRGVAPDAQIISFNAVRTPAIAHLADALQRDLHRVSISNNSWGDFNGWGEPLALRESVRAALANGTQLGRQGKGVVYVFSAGNGASIDASGTPSDNVNYSGLVNNYYTLPICATDEKGKKARYSESGATLLVCAPSRGNDVQYGIFTTDVTGGLGYNKEGTKGETDNRDYTRLFGGTSAAAPLVSGVAALMLEANPDLTWRDVRYILASTARKNDIAHPDWTMNAAGLNINHDYGFGMVDATAAIALAQQWRGLGAEVHEYAQQSVLQLIPDSTSTGLSSYITITSPMTVEFAEVTFDAPDHTRLGDLEIVLTSPSGTKSVLAERHNQTFEVFRYRDWKFGSLRHLGESATGQWRLEVRDLRSGHSGVWTKWGLKIHGYQQTTISGS